MDSNEWNKIAGWGLTAAISVLGLSILTGAWFTPAKLETPAYVVEGVEEEGAAGGAAGEAEKPIAFFLASADIAKGENQFKKCAACHTVESGAANGIGPNLYGIIGKKHAAAAGFGYSDAIKATSDKTWDWDGMSSWLQNPKKYIPGNKMSFAGLGKPQDRADLIAYLNSKSASPLPMPAVPAEAPAAEAAPAEGEVAADAAAAPAEGEVAAEAAPAEAAAA